MNKYKFENQKIFIRLVDDENPTTAPAIVAGAAQQTTSSKGSSQPNNDVIIIGSLDQTPSEKTKNSLPDDIDTEESVSSLSLFLYNSFPLTNDRYDSFFVVVVFVIVSS